MKTVYEFDEYKKWVTHKLRSLPKNGHGELKKIADYLKVNSTLLSQVFSGSKDLTVDQGFLLSEYFGLDQLETEYFLILIQMVRAGPPSHRKFLEKKKEEILTRASDLSKRLPTATFLTESDQGIYYSQWFYSAIRILFSFEEVNTFEDLCKRLPLPKEILKEAVEFMVRVGLLDKKKEIYKNTELRTYLPANSMMVGRHHSNWRQKVIEKSTHISKKELMFTSPLAISEKDSTKVRSMIVNFIAEVQKVVDPSPSEKLYSFNIDWVEIV